MYHQSPRITLADNTATDLLELVMTGSEAVTCVNLTYAGYADGGTNGEKQVVIGSVWVTAWIKGGVKSSSITNSFTASDSEVSAGSIGTSFTLTNTTKGVKLSVAVNTSLDVPPSFSYAFESLGNSFNIL